MRMHAQWPLFVPTQPWPRRHPGSSSSMHGPARTPVSATVPLWVADKDTYHKVVDPNLLDGPLAIIGPAVRGQQGRTFGALWWMWEVLLHGFAFTKEHRRCTVQIPGKARRVKRRLVWPGRADAPPRQTYGTWRGSAAGGKSENAAPPKLVPGPCCCSSSSSSSALSSSCSWCSSSSTSSSSTSEYCTRSRLTLGI